MTITAAADGSALGNPGPAGWAWYIDEDTWRAGGWPHGTNNMGELKAVLDLLEATAVDADQHLHVLCDSQYVINSVTRWMPGWKRKGWRKKDGKPVMNVELLQAIDRALVGRSVEFEWVKGHAGHRMNEAADRRANAAATAFSKGRDPQVGPGYRTSPTSTARPRAADASDAGLALAADASGAGPALAADASDLFSFLEPEPAPPAPVAPSTSELDEVTQRELALLTDLVRARPERAGALLHPDATEIGASGRAWTRSQILAELAPVPGLEASDMIADRIGEDAVLVRYRTEAPDDTGRLRTVLRSSVWIRVDGSWLLRHHQGTPARP
ncbi:RNase H family protein [Brachybacterium hainanense]|uniref:Ribonuclease H n=1 Tax=Brachybacterium hainanense TaxID=1541174 RepID=A0ABV6RG50_9MICO